MKPVPRSPLENRRSAKGNRSGNGVVKDRKREPKRVVETIERGVDNYLNGVGEVGGLSDGETTEDEEVDGEDEEDEDEEHDRDDDEDTDHPSGDNDRETKNRGGGNGDDDESSSEEELDEPTDFQSDTASTSAPPPASGSTITSSQATALPIDTLPHANPHKRPKIDSASPPISPPPATTGTFPHANPHKRAKVDSVSASISSPPATSVSPIVVAQPTTVPSTKQPPRQEPANPVQTNGVSTAIHSPPTTSVSTAAVGPQTASVSVAISSAPTTTFSPTGLLTPPASPRPAQNGNVSVVVIDPAPATTVSTVAVTPTTASVSVAVKVPPAAGPSTTEPPAPVPSTTRPPTSHITHLPTPPFAPPILVHFIRHTKAVQDFDAYKQTIRRNDPPLSAIGHQQCAVIRSHFPRVGVTHILASPLKRTVETALRIFYPLPPNSPNIRIQIVPALRPCPPPTMFNAVSNPSELRALFSSGDHVRHRDAVDWSGLPAFPNHNTTLPFHMRIPALRRMLETMCADAAREGKRLSVVVVGHGSSITELFEAMRLQSLRLSESWRTFRVEEGVKWKLEEVRMRTEVVGLRLYIFGHLLRGEKIRYIVHC